MGDAVASTCSLMTRRLPAIVLRKIPFISGSSNRIAPRAWVSITNSSRALAGATGANLARACNVNGPNRHLGEAAGRLVLGDLHGALDLPALVGPDQPRGRSDPHRPGEVLVMAVTAGSHLGWFWKWSVATNRNTSAGGRSMTWDAESRTPLPPISKAGPWMLTVCSRD